MSTHYVLVDFENVQPTTLAALNDGNARILVFVGASQTKLPFDLVTAMQQLGPRADEFVEIAGRDRVEPGGRLVEEHDLGIERQSAGERHALGHAA